MFDIWHNVKDLIAVNERKVYITNPVFVLHSKVTVLILLTFSILVTTRQYLGDPIDCVASPDIKSIADNYCWIHSTFTRVTLMRDGKWGYEAVEASEVPPGIRPEVRGEYARVYHTYYQWVWLVLFLQSGLFYVPYWLWKMCDRGRIKMLVSDLNLEILTGDDEKMTKQKDAIISYLTPNHGSHTRYAAQFFALETLNLLNICTQIFLTDAFLNYSFSSYGVQLFILNQQHPYQRRDELARVFPTVTACRIATGGVAFGTMEYDLLCVLPINILNEKIYIFLWFWFLLLALVTLINFFYRLCIVIFPPLRRLILRRRLRSMKVPAPEKLNVSYGDWFLLTKLGENLNPVVFAEILQEIHDAQISHPSTPSSFKKTLIEKDNHMQMQVEHMEETKPLHYAPVRTAGITPHHPRRK